MTKKKLREKWVPFKKVFAGMAPKGMSRRGRETIRVGTCFIYFTITYTGTEKAPGIL